MENWKAIPGYEGFYEASDLGRIRSVPRRSGRTQRFYKGRVLKLQKSTTGYLMFALATGERVTHMKVNRAVCLTFHGPAPLGSSDTRHKDGTRTNNAASNLEWGTRRQNMGDAKRHGTVPLGESRPNALLNPDKVRDIRKRKTAGETYERLAGEFGVSVGCIQRVHERSSWKHIE